MATINDFVSLQPQKYDEIRGQIQTGDILFCKGNYAFSDVISKLSGWPFSHVAVVFWLYNRVLVLESEVFFGVRAVPLSSYVNNYNNTNKPYAGDMYLGRHEETKTLDNDKISKLIGRGVDLLTRKYDNEELVRIFWRITTKMGKHEDNNEYICSEFVQECFKQIGVEFPSEQGGFTFPGSIASDQKVKALFKINTAV
ncbi:MAG: hypothetical protein KGJ87_07795 [Planctomycetota bacterium]|nr:hypothetical protein [Planctomycetota bacterium]MDE1889528.1 hypothetical protein [Planctomycetota bacterium]MDE2217042.1 hypothetical protein [Planctomycetota bacterium]